MPEEFPPLGRYFISGYDNDDPDYPIVAIAYQPEQGYGSGDGGYQLPALFTACPSLDPDFHTHVFVGSKITANYQRVLWLYMLLPGPWVYSRVFIRAGVWLETKTRNVRDTSYPAGSATILQDSVSGQTVAIAHERVETYVNGVGAALSAPIFSKVEIDWRLGVYRITKRQLQDYPGSLPTLSAVDGTGGVFVGGSVASIAVTAAGSLYTTSALVTVAPSKGVRATATSKMKGSAFVTFTTAGTGYIVGDVLTLTGGTNTTPSTITITAVGINTVAVNATGTGYLVGDTITFAGGTFALAAVATVATTKLISISVSAGGTGYVIGDTITLTGGVASIYAIVTVATAGILSAAPLAAGTGYAISDTITFTGGTFSVAAIATVSGLSLATLAVNAPGTGYAISETITLAGGTFSAAAQVRIVTAKLVSAVKGATGSGYVIGDTITMTGGTFSSAAVITLSSVRLVSVALNAAGAGYALGDTVTLAGGTFSTAASIQVLSVGGGGAIATFTILSFGNYTTTAAAFTQGSTSGGGTGATFNTPAWGAGNFSITTPGSYTALAGGLSQGSTSGVGAGMDITTCKWGALTVSVFTAGAYTVAPSSFTQGSTNVGGIGATFNTPVWGVQSVTIGTAGSYSVSAATYTQGATSGGGTGATFNTAVYKALTVTVSAPGSYTFTTTAPTQNTASGSGTGATFSSALYGLLAVSVTTSGSYTVVPASFTQGSTSGAGTGGTFNTIVGGAGVAGITTAGVYSTITSRINSLVKLSGGVGYAVGDTITLSEGTFSTAAIVTVTTISGSFATGPIATFSVSTKGLYTAVPSNGQFTQASTSGKGVGSKFQTPTYQAISTTSGGTGAGAIISLTWAVDSIVVTAGGTMYDLGGTAPTVTLTGNATATATLQDQGWTLPAAYVVDGWIESQEDKNKDMVYWVTMSLPPTRSYQISVPFTYPAFLNVTTGFFDSGFFHIPPWPGYDFDVPSAHLSGQFTGTKTLSYNLGPFSLNQCFATTSPGSASHIFSVGPRTIHNAWNIAKTDGTYAENIPASAIVGYDASGYLAETDQRNLIGNIWEAWTIYLP